MKERKLKRDELSPNDENNMFQLLCRHFSGVKRAVFLSDLNEKNWVLLIENNEGQLLGFSTVLHYVTEFQGKKISVIYSGDTIMDQEAWGTFSLSQAWIKSIKEISQLAFADRTVWLLLTSGYRTYRFLPVFWKEFYPRHDIQTPKRISNLINHIASERFGSNFNRENGIVQFDNPQQLLGELAHIPLGRHLNPHVAFFLKRNPGYLHGDELVCYAELSDDNMTKAGQRMLKQRP